MSAEEAREMNLLRDSISEAWRAMTPQERVTALRTTAADFAEDGNRFLLVDTDIPTLEAQVAALTGVVDILLRILICEATQAAGEESS